MTKSPFTTAILALTVAAFVLPIAGATDADARNGGNSVYIEESIDTKYPVKGYSGFAGPGKGALFCDYRRTPRRKCTISKKTGFEKCKVVGYTLTQYCY